MLYVLLTLVIVGVAYVGWRAIRAQGAKPQTRVIGPDDDPDFLRRLNHGD